MAKLTNAVAVILFSLVSQAALYSQLPAASQLYGEGLWHVIASGSSTNLISSSDTEDKKSFDMPDYLNTDKWLFENADVVINPSGGKQKSLLERYRSVYGYKWVIVVNTSEYVFGVFSFRKALVFELTGKSGSLMRITKLTRLSNRWVVDATLTTNSSCTTDEYYLFKLPELAYNFLIGALTHPTPQVPLVVTCDGKPVTF